MNGYLPISVFGALLLTIGLTACTTGDSVATSAKVEQSEDATAVVVEELAAGEQDSGLELDFEGPVEVEFRRITIPPGLGTGEPCHHGNLIAVVEQGTLTHYAPIYPDGVHEYETGDSVFEGAGYVHEGKNEGDEDMILMVTYLTPEGEPLAETDLARCE